MLKQTAVAVHATKVYRRGVYVWLHSFLTSVWRGGSTSLSDRFDLGIRIRYPLNRRMDAPWNRSGRFWEKKTHCLYWDQSPGSSNPQSVAKLSFCVLATLLITVHSLMLHSPVLRRTCLILSNTAPAGNGILVFGAAFSTSSIFGPHILLNTPFSVSSLVRPDILLNVPFSASSPFRPDIPLNTPFSQKTNTPHKCYFKHCCCGCLLRRGHQLRTWRGSNYRHVAYSHADVTHSQLYAHYTLHTASYQLVAFYYTLGSLTSVWQSDSECVVLSTYIHMTQNATWMAGDP